MMSLALSAPVSSMPQPSAPPNGLTFSAAPTVMTFLAVDGSPTVFPPEPPLPAAKTMTYSWLPAVGKRRAGGLRVAHQRVVFLRVHRVGVGLLPQLLLLMRAPSL